MKQSNFKVVITMLLINIFIFIGVFTANSIVKAADNKEFKIIIVSPGNKDEIYETEKLQLGKIIKNSLGNNILNEEVLWESEDTQIVKVDKGGLVIGIKEGQTKIKASLKSNKDIYTYFSLKVNHKEQVNRKDAIKEALSNISEYYGEYYKKGSSFDYLPAMSARITGKEFGIDADNLKRLMIHPDRSGFTLEEMIKKSNAVYCGENIMTIISAGQDPYNYEYKDGKINYVRMLVKSQKGDGQFVLSEGFDNGNIKSLAYSIIALDMTGEEYNIEKAVKALLKLNKDKKYNNTNYGEIGYKAMSIIALSKHKNIEGVENFIDECIKEFKSKQNDKGGFNGGHNKINSSVTTAMVIQGLIANDVKPLSWFNSGKSMLDSILEHQKDNGEFIDADGEANSDYIASDNCYAALSDLYTGESMYKTIKLPRKKDLNVELISDYKFKNGQDANIEVKVRNNVDKEKEATLIAQLYNKETNKLVQYSYINKNIEGKGIEKLKVGLSMPNSGEYTVRILAWDNINKINPLMDIFNVDVLQK